MRRLLPALLVVVVACGDTDSAQPTPCDTVLDCPEAMACVDRVCVVEDDVDGSRPQPADAGVAPDAAPDAAPGADAAGDAAAPDADLGLQGDAGFGVLGCTLPPFVGPIAPVEEFSYPPTPCTGQVCGAPACTPIAGDPFPNHVQVVATPTVANLTDDDGDGDIDLDDVPDIVFQSYNGSNISDQGVIRIVSGRPDATGKAVIQRTIPIQDTTDACYNAADAALRHDSSTSVAIGDVNADGEPDLVGLLSTGRLVAWTAEGCRLWTASEPVGPNDGNAGAPTIADLDGDGHAEVLAGRVAVDGDDGSILWIGAGDLGMGIFGVQSVAANLDLLGASEVIAGATVYGADGSIRCRNAAVGDGLNAVGNFDADPEGEFVVVKSGSVYLLDSDCAQIWQFQIGAHTTTVASTSGPVGQTCMASGGGEPTIADFDGDGAPEVALANANCYAVVDTDGSLLWASASEDDSSQGTGSSVFDFNGDGTSEVIYNDEHQLRIYNGPDGAVVFQRPNTSRTRHEYPIVADVDNDGNAELVFIENNEADFACAAGQTGGAGVHVLGDDPAVDAWVPTRRIWNQHSYHITNIAEDGRLPLAEVQNWTVPGYNNYRTNLPDFSVLAAPDLTVEFLDLAFTQCTAVPPQGTVDFRVCNRGDVRVGPGVHVAVTVDGTLSAVAETTRTLEAGECETLSLVLTMPGTGLFSLGFTVDDDGTGAGTNRECHEDNNTDVAAGLTCEYVP